MELSEIKGIGPARAASLRKLGINSVEGLATHFPRSYQDRGDLTSIADIEVDEINSVRAVVTATRLSRPGNKIMVRAVLDGDCQGHGSFDNPRSPVFLEAIWFNMPYMKSTFKSGVPYIFTGKVISRLGKLQMVSPEHEIFSPDVPRIVPIYHATAGLSQKMLRKFAKLALDKYKPAETLDERITSNYGLCSREYAVRNIHFPENDEAFFRARRRLVFEELFVMQLRLCRLKKRAAMSAGIMVKEIDFVPMRELFSFAPTEAQERVVCEIMADMSSGFRMNRLVQGDVGCGKTLIAMFAAYAVIKSGGQAALMAPTEVLALQHYRSFAVFERLNVCVAFLSGSQSGRERMIALNDIKTGRAEMVIGTHALIQSGVEFHNVGLVITDEQHRFGVRSREKLSKQGAPHVLVMTATPIPRSLALILYGDMDISIVDSLPPGRSKVDTYSVTTAQRERLYAFIEKQVDEGRQAYIICPAIEDSEAFETLESVTAMTKRLTDILKRHRLACMHGKMKPEQRNEVMAAFGEGKIDILVSTTVVEVGVNVPNATIMAIENAERFGLAQLHQLRGRVGRGMHKSYCILITDSRSKICRERLKAMKNSSDGFYISELDLKLRGGGDFFGTRQHGLPEFQIANLYQDVDILKEAQAAAEAFADCEGDAGWVVI